MITKTLLVTSVREVLKAFFSVVTPHIKQALENYINDLYQKACQTPNPADDMLVEFLAELIGVDLKKEQ